MDRRLQQPVRGAALTRIGCAAVVVGLAGCGGASGGLEVARDHHIRHNAIVRAVTSRRVVALTFDDGPDPRYTPVVLRLLARAHVRATFFDVGRRALQNPGLVRAELRAGHEVANHTYNHRMLTGLPPARIGAEIIVGIRALQRAGAPRPRFFRPPFGGFDEQVGALAAATGEQMIGWDRGLEAAIHGHAIHRAVRLLVAHMKRGAIILAHDAGPLARARTVAALPALLAQLRRHGWRVVTVGELLTLARGGQ